MKIKAFILTVIAVVLYSCSDDREENVAVTAKETKKNLKLNKSGYSNREADSQINSDTIRIKGINSLSGQDANLDPVDGGDPTTIIPPKR